MAPLLAISMKITKLQKKTPLPILQCMESLDLSAQ